MDFGKERAVRAVHKDQKDFQAATLKSRSQAPRWRPKRSLRVMVLSSIATGSDGRPN